MEHSAKPFGYVWRKAQHSPMFYFHRGRGAEHAKAIWWRNSKGVHT
jgi:hypothetical protein